MRTFFVGAAVAAWSSAFAAADDGASAAAVAMDELVG